MPSAAKTIFARDVDQIDIAYLDPSGIAGRSYHVDVSATGPLDHNGFVIDFGLLKKQLKAHLKATADHALVIPAQLPGYKLTERGQESTGGGEEWSEEQGEVSLSFKGAAGHYGYVCPADAIYPIAGATLDAGALAAQLAADLAPELPEGLSIAMALREKSLMAGSVAFTYTHGISRHDGLCQRLFHGHTGELQLTGVKDPALAATISQSCFGKGVHIASEDQLVTKAEHPLAHSDLSEADHLFLSYEGTLGRYSAAVPKARTLVLPATASIEHLAGYVFDQLYARHKELLTDALELKIWEGLNKGAAISCQASCHSTP